MVAMGTCLFGSAPYMGTHMASTSSTRLKGTGIHSVHCISFWRICQNIFFMILHAPFQSMHSTGHQSFLDLLDSGMISIGHKCGMNFKPGRIDGLEGVNTEICEQVNSYLQCIKFTGFHLSQEHFMFFYTVFLVFVEQGQNKEVQPGESSSCSISVVKY